MRNGSTVAASTAAVASPGAAGASIPARAAEQPTSTQPAAAPAARTAHTAAASAIATDAAERACAAQPPAG